MCSICKRMYNINYCRYRNYYVHYGPSYTNIYGLPKDATFWDRVRWMQLWSRYLEE